MFLNIAYVALGGALGASARYLSGLALVKAWPGVFPMGVWPVNVIGSLLMGIYVVYAHHKGLGQVNLFVMTGLLGGFTTFSAFSLEAMTLIERGLVSSALLYICLSVIVSIAALALGLVIARGIWA